MPEIESRFLQRLADKVLVFDGAMGTSIHALDLPLSDYRNLENCSEVLNETRPDAIEQIHRGFLAAGCDVVETNTFGANRVVLAEFGLADRTYELNVAAARIARRAVEAFATPEQPRFVAGSIGPGTKLPSLRQTTYDDLLASYAEQVRGLLDGGVDVLIIETCQDILQTKAAIQTTRQAFEAGGRRVPLICQVTMETSGTMLMGTDLAAAVVVLEAFPEVDVLGLNCATGPREMSAHVRYLSEHGTRRLSVMPNAGLPRIVNGQPCFPLPPAELARWLRVFVVEDGVNIVGGCCGTTPAHIKAVVEAVAELKPRQREVASEPSVSSLYSATPMRQETSFLIVGERCNTSGSRRFIRLLAEEDIEGMIELAHEQLQEGAHVLDVCVDTVGRDGTADMRMVCDRFGSDLNAPLMLDSTQVDVLEAGLKLAGGKCIVNSVSLEDGGEKLKKICRLLRQYGAAVVALTIDDDPDEAMAKTAQRKLDIATRIHELLTGKYGIRAEDIFFDCLTFPITTGNKEDRRLALETLAGIELVMTRFPRSQSILGISNVSFGLQPAARVVLNSAFLSEACQRGLTAAIIHAGKILPRTRISAERWEAALDLIHDRRHQGDPLERFISLFDEGETLGAQRRIAELPVEERLKQRIIDGRKQGLEADLDEAREKYNPLFIINELLLAGMQEVGELFGSGRMQLPFVLRSAETMKAAVAHLEPHLERVEEQARGKIVLATVRGDVHDIGKNLVDIILSNNGYKVYNLGLKQPIGNIINAFQEHDADAIGLSGLLVKSTLVMREDLEVLNEHAANVPVILGGAALTRKYVEQDLRRVYKSGLYYAQDAFEGLRLMGEIMARKAEVEAVEAQRREKEVAVETPTPEQARLLAEQRYGLKPVDVDTAERARIAETEIAIRAATVAAQDASRLGLAGGPHVPESERPCSDIGHDCPVPRPPFWGARVLETIELQTALAYLNETMLFQVQWGFRGKRRARNEWKKYVDTKVRPIYCELVERCEREKILQPQAIYGYWPCNSDGDELLIFRPPSGTIDRPEHHREVAVRFTFPRQKQHPYWCLSDFWRPVRAGTVDVAAFSIVTAGRRVGEVARQWFEQHHYRQYLFLHGLGVELAEALAEYVHQQVRVELGVAGRDARDLRKLFQQGYQGSRYSFGYPACPNLEDQAPLMKLLTPERIGVTLTEQYQLEPEQTTSALIAYHPEARYFNVR
ncbi:MAG: methionine synthase [Phycisphaerae bacterium]|nr:methionine synthase [Phycisphaerae bacterium]